MARMALIALVCLAMTLPAAADLVQNGSFELGPDLYWNGQLHGHKTLYEGSTEITGWTVSGSGEDDSIDYIGTTWAASNGSYSLDLNGLYGTGGVEQVISTTAGTPYLVTFDMAGNPAGPPTIKTMEVSASGSITLAGTFSFDVTGTTFDLMGWTTMQWTFVAGASTTTLRFLSTVTGENNAWGPALDNVSVNVVPAPAAVLLGLLGLGAAGIRLRRFA